MQVVYATRSQQVITPDGGRHWVTGGQHWPAGDPVVRAAPPDLFTDDPRVGVSFSTPPAELAEPPVERVTAGPGEQRARVRRG